MTVQADTCVLKLVEISWNWLKLVQNGIWCNIRGPFSTKLENKETQQQKWVFSTPASYSFDFFNIFSCSGSQLFLLMIFTVYLSLKTNP
jgi:hypothetical protein